MSHIEELLLLILRDPKAQQKEIEEMNLVSLIEPFKIQGQVLHSYIPLLDRSTFIEKTSTMHLRFSFYIFTDFSDPFFVHPHLSHINTTHSAERRAYSRQA